MTTAILVKQPMVRFLERFRDASQFFVVTGQITKSFANDMYKALRQEKSVMDYILSEIMEEDTGVTDAFTGFDFIFNEDDYQQYIEVESGEMYDDIHNKVIANYDRFSIHKIEIHQGQDDYLNYDSPRGEDRWLTSIVFRIHSIA